MIDVVGETVRTAERFGDMAKNHGNTIVVSAATYAKIRDVVACEPLPGGPGELAAYGVSL